MTDLKVIPSESLPELLAEIADPPERLFVAGTLPDPDTFAYLAVVGSRKYSRYGKDVCETLVGGLAGYPIAIVSGLALGIDAIAHEAALRASLPTIAVPGSGLSERALYPAAHRGLAQRIIERGGALASEFDPDFRATPYSFPQRNRIMAGLCRAVLVIEAERKSGTLITARLAMEYNRDVLAVPGSMFSSLSSGPHYLIRNGATPVASSAEVLDALGMTQEKPGEHDAESFSADEQKVLEHLAAPRTRDELIAETGLPPHALAALLSLLEIKGAVREEAGEVRRA